MVDSPAVKEYPPLGLLKSLLVLAAAARAAKSEVTVMKCIMDRCVLNVGGISERIIKSDCEKSDNVV